jgi:iron complex outermembrane recepter protein
MAASLPIRRTSITRLFGGNPNLQPEEADTLTLGVILQPRFIPGLAITVDRFDIEVKNVIGTSTFASVFDNCFGGDAAACALINRAPGTGSLWLGQSGFVILTNQNFADSALETKGWDFQGSYSRRLGGLGTVNASFVGTLLDSVSGAGVGRVGSYAGLVPAPKWRHTARVGLTMPSGIGASVRWRHFSGVECDPNVDPDTGSPFDPGCGNATNPELGHSWPTCG